MSSLAQSNMALSQLDHAENCGKLPALNMRGPQKSGR